MVEDCGLSPPLRISGDLAGPEGQIAIAFMAQLREAETLTDSVHYPAEAVTNVTPSRVPPEGQDDRVVQAARS